MSKLQTLLDAGWVVTCNKQVDGQYHAHVRKPGQSSKEVLPQISIGNRGRLKRISDGIPGQCGVGETPEQAIKEIRA